MFKTVVQHNYQESTTFEKKVEIPNGHLLVNENLIALVLQDKLIRTWPATGWTFLELDQDKQYAIFEADDSWLLALLNLQTGEWTADEDFMFPIFSLEEDRNGEYIYNHETRERIYLSVV